MLNAIERKAFTTIQEFENYLDLTEEQSSLYSFLLNLLLEINKEQDSEVIKMMRKDLYSYLNKHAKEFE